MAPSVKVGSFVKDATTGAHQQVITGIGFQPKAVIFFSSMQTATGVAADANAMIGFSDGTTHKCCAMSSNDGATTSASSNSLNSLNCIVILQNGTTTIDSAGDIDAFGSDGWTIGWNTASATQFIIGYIAIGGSDITNTKVMKHDAIGGAGSYTGVGFRPDIIFFLYGARIAAEANNATANGGVGFGASTGPSKSACTQAVIENGRTTSDTWRKQTIVSPMSMIDTADGSSNRDDYGTLTSIDADGFSLGAPSSSSTAPDFFTLSIKGGTWDVGNFSQNTTTGTQNTAILAGLDPQLLILCSANNTVNQLSGNGGSAGVAHSRLSFGASDGTNERSIWSGDTDNRVLSGNPTISKSSYSDTKTIELTTEPSTVNAAADFSAHTSGQFTLNWTTADSTARLLWYIALAGGAGTTPVSQTSIHEYNILKNVAQSSIQKYNLRKYLTQTSIQKYNIRVFVAILASIQKYNILRYLTQTNIQKYNIFKQILQASIQKYNLRRYIPQTNIHKYNTRQYVKAGKARLVIHIPLYIYPFHWITNNEWQQVSDIIAANPDIDFILKVNPDSGPGASLNSDFTAGFNILAAGNNLLHTKIIGYVYTLYGDRPISEVKADVDKYVTWYGQYIRGIFLDEMEDDAGEESYYQEITAYCHDRNFLSWGNPGKNISESYVSSNALDIFQISETDGYPTGTTIGNNTFNGTYPTSRFAIGIYNAPTYNTALIEDFATKAQYIFVTSDVGPNPYDTVSEYIDDLVLHSRALLGSKQKYNLRQFVAATLSIHKYNIIQILTVIQASIQKYNLRKYLAQTNIHKYSLRAYLAQISIQKYNLRKFLAQTNIQKYNLFKYLVQSSIQKYNISKSILQASIQKYAIRQAIVQTSIQKYNVLKAILQSSIQKYSIRKQILQATIQKYNISKSILQASIQKYSLRQYIIHPSIQKYNTIKIILQSSIQKYNLRKYLSQSSIQKYNLLRNVVQVSLHKYHILVPVAITANVQKYNIAKYIVQNSLQKYNMLAYVSRLSVHKYNISKLILAFSVQKYAIRQYVSALSKQKYNILQYVSQLSKQKYHIRIFVAITNSIQKYNIVKAILQSSVQKYNMRQYLLQTTRHKYDIIVLNVVIAASIMKYNISQYIAQTNKHKYHIMVFLSQSSIQKYNLLRNVLQASIQKYSTLAYLSQSSIQKYNLYKNILQSTIHKWKISMYATALNKQKYDIRAYIAQTSKQKYNILIYLTAASIQKYNLLKYVLQTSIHKYDIAALFAVLAQTIQKYNVRAYVSQTTKHKYNIQAIAILLVSLISKYNIRENVLVEGRHKYSIFAQVLRENIHKYNMRAQLAISNIHKYDMRAFAQAITIQKYHVLVYTQITETIHKYQILLAAIATSVHKYDIRAQVRTNSIHKYTIGKKVRKFISMLGGGKLIEVDNAAKLLQDYIKSRWPT